MKNYILLNILIFCFTLQGYSQINPETVEIIRDQWGVPHIYSPTDAGVAYGLAWAHAEDDFKSIQLTLIAGNGRIGEYLGKDGAPIDYVSGLLRSRQTAAERMDDFSADFLTVLQAYVDGLNQYALYHPKELLIKKFFPITTVEVITAFVFSLNMFTDAEKTISELYKNRVPNVLKNGQNGSNAIAISRNKTKDEYTYMAINSHQPLEGPLAWYEVHLVSDEGWNILGANFPLGPTVFVGCNENLAWGHTVNYPDKTDVYELEMHPKKKNLYKMDESWMELEVEKIPLKMKLLFFKIRIKKKAYWSIYGPAIKNKTGVFSFSNGAMYDIRAVEQWYRMNKASNFLEFKNALEMVSIPGFNVVYADRDNNLYHLGNGKLPFRNTDYDWSGTVPGNTKKTLTKEFHRLEDLPQNINPESGFVFNTNNSAFSSTSAGYNPQPADYDSTMGFLVWENNRSRRLLDIMSQYEIIDWQEFIKMKYDLQLPDSLHYFIDMNPLMRLANTGEEELDRLLKIIQQWDRKADTLSVGAAQFGIVYDRIRFKHRNRTEHYYLPEEQEYIDALRYAYDYLIKHFGKLEVKVGEIQRHIRGEVDLPLSGMPDVLAAMYSQPWENGRVRGWAGESYILLVRFPENGDPILESVNAYGASAKKDSPHYTDQMELFVKQQRKSMTLDLDEVRKSAKKIYHPK